MGTIDPYAWSRLKAKLACPECPVCGEEPGMLIGVTQAICYTTDCSIIKWDPSASKEANLADRQDIELPSK